MFSFICVKKTLEKHMEVCENKDYCYIEMPKENTISKYNHDTKSMKAPYVTYADNEFLLRIMDTCSNDPNKSSTEKKSKHEMCGYSLSTNCSFNEENNKLEVKIV